MLGVADTTGELTRLCVSISSTQHRDFCPNICLFLQTLLKVFLSLPQKNHSDLNRKISVMESSVLKVELICFNLKIRGSEYYATFDQQESNED